MTGYNLKVINKIPTEHYIITIIYSYDIVNLKTSCYLYSQSKLTNPKSVRNKAHAY